MIAVLLYLIGLVAALVTAVMLGFEAQSFYDGLMAAIRMGNNGNAANTVVSYLLQVANLHQWVVVPFLGGLLLMGFARIMMLLGAINRAVRQGV